MSSSLFSDDALSVAALALKGLTARHQTISSNIANVDTPGYNAKQLDFETTLQSNLNKTASRVSMAKTSSKHLDVNTSSSSSFYTTSNRAGGTYREDGNNVDIDTELIDMSETNIKYQAISQEISSKLLLLKSIAQGG